MASAVHPALRPVDAGAVTPSPTRPYQPDSRAYLQDELARVALLVRAHAARARSVAAALPEEFRWDEPAGDPEYAECVAAAEQLERQTVARLRRTQDEVRAVFPAWELARRFGLVPELATVVPRFKEGVPSDAPPVRDTLALDVILLAFLLDRFPAYRAAVGADGLTPEVALRVLQPTASPADLRWEVLDPAAPLLGNDLVAVRPAVAGGRPVVTTDPRVAAYLLHKDPPPDPVLGGAAVFVHEWRNWGTVRLDQEATDQLQRLSAWWWADREGAALTVLLHGPWGTPFLKVVQAFLTQEISTRNGVTRLAHPVLAVDAAAGLRSPDWADFVRRAYREAVFRKSVVLWTHGEAVLTDDPAAGRWDALMRQAELAGLPTFVASRVGWDPTDAFRAPRRYFVRVDLSIPSAPVRRGVWRSTLRREPNPIAADTSPAERVALDLLESFEFTQGEIEDAVATARGLSLLAPPAPDDRKVAQSAELLAEACRRQAARRPVSFSRRMPPRLSPAELTADPKDVLRRRVVLPAAAGQQLAELLDRMSNLSRVYRDLSFEQRLTLGRGLLVLFAGPPGTGKTLAATTLAGLLRKDLYRVDTAAVASRFVGETEKNLGRVFGDVQNSNSVLFFDEADALFGQRGEVVNGADRWANMQVSFLLQRVEEFTGTVILATNARESIDPAFFRRFQVLIDFPRPDSVGRLSILEGMVTGTAVQVADPTGRVAATPEEVRAALKPIADRFDLTGGNLKNVLLDATFRAVAGSTTEVPVLTTRDLVLGVARELQKDGKSVSVATFGKDWFALVERELNLGRA